MSLSSIVLQAQKPKKARSGLYLDQDLYEAVKGIAERSGMSYNETMIELIKAGLAANTNNKEH